MWLQSCVCTQLSTFLLSVLGVKDPEPKGMVPLDDIEVKSSSQSLTFELRKRSKGILASVKMVSG